MFGGIINRVLLLTGLAVSGANAAVIQYNAIFDVDNTLNSDVTYGSTLSDSDTIVQEVTLNRFDSSLGTLTGVDISFTSSWTHVSYGYASDSAPTTHSYRHRHCRWWCSTHTHYYYSNDTFISGTANAIFTVELYDPASTSSLVSDSNSISCSNYTSSRNAVSCENSIVDDGNSYDGSLDLSSFSLSEFVGAADDLNLRFTNYADFSATCDNNDFGDRCQGWNDTFWAGDITVTYEYTVNTPEPVSLLLMACGLLCSGLFRRKRLA